MNRTELLILVLLVAFIAIALVVFRGRRWQGALGWVLIVGSFMTSIVRSRQEDSWLSLTVVLVVLMGMGLATYDYLHFERPRRRQRRAQRNLLLDGPPPIRRTRRLALRRRRMPRPQEHINHE